VTARSPLRWHRELVAARRPVAVPGRAGQGWVPKRLSSSLAWRGRIPGGVSEDSRGAAEARGPGLRHGHPHGPSARGPRPRHVGAACPGASSSGLSVATYRAQGRLIRPFRFLHPILPAIGRAEARKNLARLRARIEAGIPP
jgi:hypothetical protein